MALLPKIVFEFRKSGWDVQNMVDKMHLYLTAVAAASAYVGMGKTVRQTLQKNS